MDSMTELLYRLCNFLLLPVLVTILIFLGWVAVLAGGFLRECLSRAAARKELDSCLCAAKQNSGSERLWNLMRESRTGMLAAFAARVTPEMRCRKVLAHTVGELEHDIAASMARLSLLTRIGPMLGLMGTLIPLGPALTGLASGNTRVMAQNLVVAFTATVIGVLIGSLSYGMGLIRRTWYGKDLSDLEFICEHLSEQEPRA